MRGEDLIKYIDPETEVDLSDAGLPGFTAAETVDSLGDRQLWIVDLDQLAHCDDVDHGEEHPSHDELGPLPVEWRERIRTAPIMCGRPCSDGHPCRISVSRPGHACGWHRKQVTS